MAFTGMGLWIDICLLALLFCLLPTCETSRHTRRYLREKPPISNTPEALRHATESLYKKREAYRDDLSLELHHQRQREHRHRLDLDRQKNYGHRSQGSLYNKLASFVSEKNLVALKRLLGDNRGDRNRNDNSYNNNRHRHNLYPYLRSRGQHSNENRREEDETLYSFENRQDERLHTFENRQDERLHTFENRQDERLHTFENRHERLHTFENRQDERLHTFENRQDERLHTFENRHERLHTYENRHENRHRNDRLAQRKGESSHRLQHYREPNYREERDRSRYGNRYVDEYNKRYPNSHNRQRYNLDHYRERSSYRSGGSSYKRPKPVDRKRSYNNLRTRLENLNLEDVRDKNYESRLKQLKARLTQNLLNIDQSPVKSLLRAADDLDCAAQLQCIQGCLKKKDEKKKDDCSNTCEDEIECNDDDQEEDLCQESGHDSCGVQGTGSTKGELVDLADAGGC